MLFVVGIHVISLENVFKENCTTEQVSLTVSEKAVCVCLCV